VAQNQNKNPRNDARLPFIHIIYNINYSVSSVYFRPVCLDVARRPYNIMHTAIYVHRCFVARKPCTISCIKRST
jgi:hypothetical protein